VVTPQTFIRVLLGSSPGYLVRNEHTVSLTTFEVLSAVTTGINIFWSVIASDLTDIYQRFGGECASIFRKNIKAHQKKRLAI
jgi:hypothetical protein